MAIDTVKWRTIDSHDGSSIDIDQVSVDAECMFVFLGSFFNEQFRLVLLQ